ncbi:ribokinase isoform X2 [Dendroctonus ponderosae]|uniref:Ribokinase n=1 Tax=Dendroctonus ponderosae TaxID=77166 RepID=A0AAR5QAT3_DENPD|nr:ribokinase isoform X2 [Dendroctonus ponderosae]
MYDRFCQVGDDVWGPKYIANLESLQVNTQYVKTTENSSSGIAQINVADNGMNQIIIVAGANQRLNLKDIEDAESIISSADVLVLQLETPVETAIRALQLAKGVSILNGAPAIETFNEELLRLPSIFCVNESEASIFSGLPVNNPNEAETAAKELIAKGCQSVLITLGEDGAIFLTSDPNVPVFKADAPQVKSADTTGAGDAFIGALAFCLANLKEFSIQQAIKAACIVAADSVTRLGTQISFPGEEILIRIV